MTTAHEEALGQEPRTAPAEPGGEPVKQRKWLFRLGLLFAFLAALALGAAVAHWVAGQPGTADGIDARKEASLAERAPDVDPSVPESRQADYRAAMAAIDTYHQQWLTLYASGADPATATTAFPGSTARFAAEEASRYAYFREVGHTLLPGGTWVTNSGHWVSEDDTGLAIDVCDSRMISVKDDQNGEFHREEPRAPWRYYLRQQDGAWVLSSLEFREGTC